MKGEALGQLVDAVQALAHELDVELPAVLETPDVGPLLERVRQALIDTPLERPRKERQKILRSFETWTELPPERRGVRRLQVVVLLHGIRTQAEWQQEVAASLAAEPRRVVHPIGYEYFPAPRFICPVLTRRKPIERVRRKIDDILLQHPDRELIIIAHSFGTFTITEILREHPRIRPNVLILCGSVVRESYEWDTLKNLPPVIINDCGMQDIWPVMAKSTTWGFGASGRFGFQSNRVQDRYHHCGHSGFLNAKFARTFWLPLVERTKKKPGANRQAESWMVSVLSRTPLRWLFLFLLALVFWLCLRAWW